MNSYHEPVLLSEVLDFLVTDRQGTYVDATLGGGGHTGGLCDVLTGSGRVVSFDVDEDSLSYARSHLESFKERITFVRANFKAVQRELNALRIFEVHGVLLDLGVSSHQLDEPGKGFSFRTDERLDMRMDNRAALTAFEVVNTYAESDLADILWRFGEERRSRRLARVMVNARPIETTGVLREVIEKAVGHRNLIKTLARVFQALRIEVNRELENLALALRDSVSLLVKGGRIVVISYHSLEDRLVKQFFADKSRTRIPSHEKLVPDSTVTPVLRILTRKPLLATDLEIKRNPRSRSAKMRAAEKL